MDRRFHQFYHFLNGWSDVGIAPLLPAGTFR